MGNEGLVLLTV